MPCRPAAWSYICISRRSPFAGPRPVGMLLRASTWRFCIPGLRRSRRLQRRACLHISCTAYDSAAAKRSLPARTMRGLEVNHVYDSKHAPMHTDSRNFNKASSPCQHAGCDAHAPVQMECLPAISMYVAVVSLHMHSLMATATLTLLPGALMQKHVQQKPPPRRLLAAAEQLCSHVPDLASVILRAGAACSYTKLFDMILSITTNARLSLARRQSAVQVALCNAHTGMLAECSWASLCCSMHSVYCSALSRSSCTLAGVKYQL